MHKLCKLANLKSRISRKVLNRFLKSRHFWNRDVCSFHILQLKISFIQRWKISFFLIMQISLKIFMKNVENFEIKKLLWKRFKLIYKSFICDKNPKSYDSKCPNTGKSRSGSHINIWYNFKVLLLWNHWAYWAHTRPQ